MAGKRKLKTTEGLSPHLTFHFLNNVWTYHTWPPCWSPNRSSLGQMMSGRRCRLISLKSATWSSRQKHQIRVCRLRRAAGMLPPPQEKTPKEPTHPGKRVLIIPPSPHRRQLTGRVTNGLVGPDPLKQAALLPRDLLPAGLTLSTNTPRLFHGLVRVRPQITHLESSPITRSRLASRAFN